MTKPVSADQLRITVEMGDDYTPSDRLAGALSELREALGDDDDVGGFGLFPTSLLFDSGSQLGGSSGDGSVFPKVETFYKVDAFYKAASIWKF